MPLIVWELALVVGAVVAFAIWQFRTLARDQAITRREREDRERAERDCVGSVVEPDGNGSDRCGGGRASVSRDASGVVAPADAAGDLPERSQCPSR